MGFYKTWFVLCVNLLIVTGLFSQDGILKGVIKDESNLGLPGATIYIATLEKGAVTDVYGNYMMRDIPEGSHSATVSYIGYQEKSIEFDINDGQVTVTDVEMTPGVYIGQEILVLGDRLKGQAKALNQQRNQMNVSNIIASDQIGRFPDANVGDALKRVTGITMQGDQGEARNIIVRGLAPHLNSVTLNGDRIPSAEGDNRNIQMDLIPADMVQTIEVSKAITPDMDADAIGGSVNLVTRSAPNGFRVSATAASGYNFLSEKPNLTGGLILGNRFADGKLGVLLSGSYNNNKFGSDNVEGEWENEAESPFDGGRH